jgi:hypothetical protein
MGRGVLRQYVCEQKGFMLRKEWEGKSDVYILSIAVSQL